jgi:hypothetical protein
MATVDAFGGKFIGNDFVAPRVQRRVTQPVAVRPHRYVPHLPQVEIAAPIAEPQVVYETPRYEYETSDFITQVEPTRRVNVDLSYLTRYISLRTGLIALSTILVLGALIVAVPRLASAEHVVSGVTSRIAAGYHNEMHPAAQNSFVMPTNAVLVRNSALSTYIDAVESQSITINLSGSTVTPGPVDIAKWFTQSTGPEKATTILKANQGSIASYLTSVGQNSSPEAISNATGQLAKALLSYGGITVDLSGSN